MRNRDRAAIDHEHTAPVGDHSEQKTDEFEPSPLEKAETALSRPDLGGPDGIVALQAAAGNRAAGRVIQAKLEVGAAGDRYEQEADQVADQVVARLSDTAQRQEIPEEEELLQATHTHLQRQPLEEEEELLQPTHDTAQRQEIPEEEELLQASHLDLAQRQPLEEEEELLQATHDTAQRQEIPEEEEMLQATHLDLAQRQPLEEEEEEELLQPSRDTAQRQEMPEEEEMLQASAEVGLEGGLLGEDTESAIRDMKGSGKPLEGGLRRSMEDAFGGADFSGVRVHTGPKTSELNKKIQAKAFTTGTDMFIRDRDYRPSTTDGQRLIAHELTHIIQQGGGARPAVTNTAQRNLVQRDLDPANPTWQDAESVSLIPGGSANKGTYRVDGGDQSMVIQFTNEDTRRVEFADAALEAAGASNTRSHAYTNPQVDAVDFAGNPALQTLYQLATSSGNDDVLAKLESSRSAQSFVLMAWVPGVDYKDVGSTLPQFVYEKAEGDDEGAKAAVAEVTKKQQASAAAGWAPEQVVQNVTSDGFLKGLGRIAAADALLGNSDRISALAQGHDSWGVFNTENLKVMADGAVGAIDNDTEIASRRWLADLGHPMDTEAWVDFLIGGGEQHIGPVPEGQMSATERVTQGLESIFDERLIGSIWQAVVGKIPLPGDEARSPEEILPKDTFVTKFKEGAKEGLAGIAGEAENLKAKATQLGGADGSQLIDPEGLELKIKYLELREGHVPAKALKMVKEMAAHRQYQRAGVPPRRVPEFLDRIEDLKLPESVQAAVPKGLGRLLKPKQSPQKLRATQDVDIGQFLQVYEVQFMPAMRGISPDLKDMTSVMKDGKTLMKSLTSNTADHPVAEQDRRAALRARVDQDAQEAAARIGISSFLEGKATELASAMRKAQGNAYAEELQDEATELEGLHAQATEARKDLEQISKMLTNEALRGQVGLG